jgi:anti-sigma B factor antagonist
MSLLKSNLGITSERIEKGVVILCLARKLLPLGSDPLKSRIDDLVYAGHLSVLLDLLQLSKMDSSDIGNLIRANLSVRKAGGKIHICNVQPEINTLLELTRLNSVFNIHPTVEDAIRSLSGQKNPFGSSLPTLK